MELFSWDAVAEAAKSGIRSAMPTWNILNQIEGDIVEKLRDLDVSHIAASRRILAGDSLIFLVTASITIKSLPMPCILVNFNHMGLLLSS